MASSRTTILGLVLALVGLGVAVTFDAWHDMFSIALRDEEQSHVLVVPAVAAWLLLVRWGRLRHYAPVGRLAGPAIVCAGWAMSYFGYYNAVQALWHAGALTIILGLLVSCVGINFLLRFFPAFAVLVFLIPVPGLIRQAIAGPSQTATAAITQMVLETIGIPVERSGNLLTLNGHDVAVAEACNGMRMVFALILVSFAFAFTMPLRPLVRVLILLASPLAAVFCNILRMTPTVILYGYHPGWLADRFHDLAGWAMLPIAFVMLLGVIKLFKWALIPVSRFNLAYE